MISDEFGRNEIRLLPPREKNCPLCADRHTEKEPHNRNSLYYQMQFFRKHGRLPRWADTLEDCTELMRAYWRGEMVRKGVPVEETMEHDEKRMD